MLHSKWCIVSKLISVNITKNECKSFGIDSAPLDSFILEQEHISDQQCRNSKRHRLVHCFLTASFVAKFLMTLGDTFMNPHISIINSSLGESA